MNTRDKLTPNIKPKTPSVFSFEDSKAKTANFLNVSKGEVNVYDSQITKTAEQTLKTNSNVFKRKTQNSDAKQNSTLATKNLHQKLRQQDLSVNPIMKTIKPVRIPNLVQKMFKVSQEKKKVQEGTPIDLYADGQKLLSSVSKIGEKTDKNQHFLSNSLAGDAFKRQKTLNTLDAKRSNQTGTPRKPSPSILIKSGNSKPVLPSASRTLPGAAPKSPQSILKKTVSRFDNQGVPIVYENLIKKQAEALISPVDKQNPKLAVNGFQSEANYQFASSKLCESQLGSQRANISASRWFSRGETGLGMQLPIKGDQNSKIEQIRSKHQKSSSVQINEGNDIFLSISNRMVNQTLTNQLSIENDIKIEIPVFDQENFLTAASNSAAPPNSSKIGFEKEANVVFSKERSKNGKVTFPEPISQIFDHQQPKAFKNSKSTLILEPLQIAKQLPIDITKHSGQHVNNSAYVSHRGSLSGTPRQSIQGDRKTLLKDVIVPIELRACFRYKPLPKTHSLRNLSPSQPKPSARFSKLKSVSNNASPKANKNRSLKSLKNVTTGKLGLKLKNFPLSSNPFKQSQFEKFVSKNKNLCKKVFGQTHFTDQFVDVIQADEKNRLQKPPLSELQKTRQRSSSPKTKNVPMSPTKKRFLTTFTTSENFYFSLKPRLRNKIKSSFSATGSFPATTHEFYKFIKIIGEGSMGKVYLADLVLNGQLVAIKQIPRTKLLERELRERFLQEIAILRELKHQNVIKVLETYETKVDIFLVTEYASNGDLLAIMKRKGRFPELDWWKILKQLAFCLIYLKSKKVLHRDIKLENVLLDQNGSVKLCDFGVAHVYRNEESIKEVIGTPAYCAPEVIAGSDYQGFASDVWSLGVMSYIALTGKIPFKAESVEEIKQKILAAQVSFPANSTLSEEIKNLVLRMLTTNPADRISVSEIYAVAERQSIVWTGAGPLPAAFDTLPPLQKKKTIDERKVETLERLGIPANFIRTVIRSKILNHVYALYCTSQD